MVALNMPTVAVSVDFAHDPMSASFTWTNLTKRSWDFSATRGRTYELTQVQSGTAKVTMENVDGAIDPTNASSPYSPNVLPFRRLKFEATWSGHLYAVYAGLVERWPMEWQDNLSVSPVECVDVFAILANKDLRAAVLAEALDDAPSAVYPLNEPAGSTSAVDASGQQAAAVIQVSPYGAGSLSFGVNGPMIGQPTMMAVTSPDAGQASGDIPVAGSNPVRATWLKAPNALAGLTTGTYDLWFVGPSSPPPTVSEFIAALVTTTSGGTSSRNFAVFVNPTTGYLSVDLFTTVAVNVCDGELHHVEVDLTSGGSGHLYLDGVLQQTIAVGGGGAPIFPTTGSSWILGALVFFDDTAQTSVDVIGLPFSGSIAMFGQYPSALSGARASAHWHAGADGFVGETADARIARLLAYAGWTGATAIDASPTAMLGTGDISGQKALTAIQAVATTEGGTFFVARDGTLTYQSRRTRMANVTPVATFGDGPGELPYEGISFDYDPTYIYNDVEISRSTAPTGSASDSTSASHYGPRTLSQQMDIDSDAELADAVAWLLAAYKDPHMRVASITLHPSVVTSVDLWTACLSLEIGSRVTVKRRPKGTTNPNPISGDYFVEQVTVQRWTADDAVFQLALSPISIQALIADDPVFGLSDTAGLVAAW